ncbi:MAG: hypothetical protein ACLFUU_03980, partial [Desulfobacteraceae bacterium]
LPGLPGPRSPVRPIIKLPFLIKPGGIYPPGFSSGTSPTDSKNRVVLCADKVEAGPLTLRQLIFNKIQNRNNFLKTIIKFG